MNVAYDLRTDALTVILKDPATAAENDEDKLGVILDYDGGDDLVSIEVIDASRRVSGTRRSSSRCRNGANLAAGNADPREMDEERHAWRQSQIQSRSIPGSCWGSR